VKLSYRSVCWASARRRNCLRECLDRFGAEDVEHETHSGHVRAGVGKAADQARLHGIGDPHNDDRHGSSGASRGLGGRRVHRNKDVNFEAQEIGDQRRKTIASAFSIPHIDDDAFALDVPKPTTCGRR
jgi:hypothetical protein